ncbi:MAG: uracil-DNA glycosylase [Actinobacteria bacterium]|nr:uracil-DNA glycosylase [Actinomycetota bacterium]
MARDFEKLAGEITACRKCSRLVKWREKVAVQKRASYATETYWGKPIAGFGDVRAKILVLGLAPGAHGANRTGRIFTGDRSGDWLFRAMHKAGLASQPESISRDDGLTLKNAWVATAVRCAPPDNKPTPRERKNCASYLTRELAMLSNVKVIVCLGGFSLTAVCDELDIRPRPKFGHGVVVDHERYKIVCSYHPSQQNTFTGRLTEKMFDKVFATAVRLQS